MIVAGRGLGHPLTGALLEAIRTRRPLAARPSSDDLSLDAAYEAQEALIAGLGGQVEAAKLGLTSRAKQVQMNVGEPAYGWLLSGSRITPEAPLVVGELIQPRAEPEIAFLLGHALTGPDVSVADVLAATKGIAPAIDILDSRYAGYNFTLVDVIADNASAARFAVGDLVDPNGIDLRLLGCVFTKNGELLATAAGAAVLDHPAAAVAWFANKLATRGLRLEAGTLVLSGGLTGAVPLAAGDELKAEFDRIGTIRLEAR